MTNLKEGDRVLFLDEKGGGVVLAIDSSEVVVEDQDGFERRVLPSQLVLEQKIAYQDPEFQKDEKLVKPIVRQPASETIEVDLHLHELIRYQKRMTNHEKVTLQLNYAKESLENARRSGANRIILIHGVGAGTLKSALRKWLDTQTNLEYFDASVLEYGYGATEVKLWVN